MWSKIKKQIKTFTSLPIKAISTIYHSISFDVKKTFECLWLVDRVSLGILLLLIGVSSFELISSLQMIEWRMAKDLFLFKKHMILIMVFLLGTLFLSQQKFEVNVMIAGLIGGFAIILCIFVLFMGRNVNGSKRWINLLGVFNMQPSVFLKNTIGIFLPFLFTDMNKHLIFVGICSGIVILQPDMGMTLLILSISLTEILLMYDNLTKYIFFIISGLGIGSVFLLLKGNYILLRVNKFFSGSGLYQSNVAITNMRNTSLFGQNNHIPIPDSHCDFIFASITSHYGILVGIGIIFLFILLFVRNIQQTSNLPFHKRIVVYGILSQISYQTIFHLASNLSFIPPKGVSCPFLSSGGSEILASIISMGTLFSITRKKL